MSTIERILSFAQKTKDKVITKLVDFGKGVINHTESIVILGLASIGVNALLSELPFYVALPLWIEATMVIPALSVLAVSFLIASAAYRHTHRLVIA